MKIIVRIFVWRGSVRNQHSFLVSNDQWGLTSGVGALAVNENKITLDDLRGVLETKIDKGMCRRTTIFEEVLFTLSEAPNPHGYPQDVCATSYQFGIVRRPPVPEDGKEAEEELAWVPDIVPVAAERGTKLGDILPPLGAQDLPSIVIVPGETKRTRERDRECGTRRWQEGGTGKRGAGKRGKGGMGDQRGRLDGRSVERAGRGACVARVWCVCGACSMGGLPHRGARTVERT